MNKWQLNRAGLLNYWYYDEEEFQFADGRLLLRGGNGSGKSVTMQSLITVLLDGVKSPDRLDSFGSRSRRMEDYLLGEKEIVNRDERTGYLYLEYKRRQTQQYLTTGIGLQVKRSGGLDFWGFVITDNRRIKYDFHLYKREINPEDGSRQRIPLTRGELERALGTGGQVVRSQKEYMELVNRHVFGFETVEQYQELMKLLVQLRSPKLSKDFKPSVIYEILNESLPSLSEEELRPLSDTIESLERTKLQIEQLERDRQALGRLCRQYDVYNDYILAEKTDLAQKAQRRHARLEREEKELQQRLATDNSQLIKEGQRQAELERELAVLENEKRELEKHDAFRAEEQKQERETQLARILADRQDKDRQLTGKQKREREEQQQALSCEQQAEEACGRMDQMRQELTDAAGEAGFDRHDILVRAFMDNSQAFSFPVWRQNVNQHLARLEAVLDLLRRQAEARERRDRIERELGEERRLLDEYRSEHRRLEQQFMECRDQLLADLYSWQEKYAQDVLLTQDELRQVAQAMQGLYEGYSWNDVQEPVEAAYGRRVKSINQDLGLANARIKQLEVEEQGIARELKEWQSRKEPEPERLPDSQATRRLLTERGIPFVPFYAAVEFAAQMTPDLKERIEAALTDMGLLDALIVPANRLGEIPAGDAYGAVIRPNPQIMAATLADYLYPTPAEGEAVTAADIDEALRSILIDEPAAWTMAGDSSPAALPSLSAANGTYRIGIVAGRASRRQTALYIGKQARQEYRRQQIVRLEEQLAGLALELERQHAVCNGLRRELEQAAAAKANFLTEQKILGIHHDKQSAMADINRQEQRVQLVDSRLREVAAELKVLRDQLATAGEGLKLTPDEASYKTAVQAMRGYLSDLHTLELCHQDFVNSTANARQYRARLQETREEVDGLKGELLVLDGQMEKIKLEIEQIAIRLKEMGAEELRERIRLVTGRLAEIPQASKAAVAAEARLRESIAAMGAKLGQIQVRLEFAGILGRCWQEILRDELRLGLVYPADQPLPDPGTILLQKGGLLKQERLDRTSVTDRLSKSFFVENNMLMEYRMQLEPLVPDLDGLPALPPELAAETGEDDGLSAEFDKLREKAQRQVITLDYEGRRQNPYQLQHALERQIAEQTAILSNKDKELYEEVIMNSIGRIISRRIRAAEQWVEDMNKLMLRRDNSSGLRFKLEWKAKHAAEDEQLDTQDLVYLLHADPASLKEEDLNKIVRHFQSRIERAKDTSKNAGAEGGEATFQQAVREVLDYRLWFQFKLFYDQSYPAWRELTDKVFFKFSGGEKAMAMYIPLFSAAYSRYREARADAPFIITLDEAFAGVDENNIRDTFALVEQLGFNYIMNSQALWGDYDVVPSLTICELVRPKNAPYVTVVRYHWDGRVRTLAVDVPEEPLALAAATRNDQEQSE